MSQRKAFREHFPDEIVIMRPGIRWPARVALAPGNAEASPMLTGPKGLPRPLWALEELPVWTSLAVQWLRLCCPNAGGTGSISGQGTKILHAAQLGQKTRKQFSCLTTQHSFQIGLSFLNVFLKAYIHQHKKYIYVNFLHLGKLKISKLTPGDKTVDSEQSRHGPISTGNPLGRLEKDCLKPWSSFLSFPEKQSLCIL